MSLPDVVSGLLLSEGSDVRIVSGVPDKRGRSNILPLFLNHGKAQEKETNEANNYDSDNLFVECDEAGYYTNELGDIMPNRFNKPTYFCKSIAETAAKFTDLCLKADADIYDIYTSY